MLTSLLTMRMLCKISGFGRSTEEGISYPLQYSWASLVAQLVKNPSAMWETWVRSLGWENLLEKGKATHSSIPAWRTPWTVRSLGLQRLWYNSPVLCRFPVWTSLIAQLVRVDKHELVERETTLMYEALRWPRKWHHISYFFSSHLMIITNLWGRYHYFY